MQDKLPVVVNQTFDLYVAQVASGYSGAAREAYISALNALSEQEEEMLTALIWQYRDNPSRRSGADRP